MLINVTQKHIDEGWLADGERCAVALAMRDAGFKFVNVDQCEIYVMNERGDVLERYVTPPVVASFIRQFDSGCFVAPLSFEMPQTGTVFLEELEEALVPA